MRSYRTFPPVGPHQGQSTALGVIPSPGSWFSDYPRDLFPAFFFFLDLVLRCVPGVGTVTVPRVGTPREVFHRVNRYVAISLRFSTGSICPFPADGIFEAVCPQRSTRHIAFGEGLFFF